MENSVKEALKTLNSYAASDYASYNVCLKAIGETIKDDIGGQWVIGFLEINNTFPAHVWNSAIM